MKTQISQPTGSYPPSVPTQTPILTGYYYAIKDDSSQHYTLVQIVQQNGIENHKEIKIRQFGTSLKALPDFINPDYLGVAVAQFWLGMGEFLSWQPVLLQRGMIDEIIN